MTIYEYRFFLLAMSTFVFDPGIRFQSEYSNTVQSTVQNKNNLTNKTCERISLVSRDHSHDDEQSY
jgi:hypothetical protein